MVKSDVLIVGGGLAGITVAVALAGSGQRVVLVEAEDRLGGRASSWTDPATGDPVAIGPHIILSEYLNFLQLLQILEVDHHILWEGRTVVTMVNGETSVVMRDSRFLPAPFQFIPSLMSDPFITTADWISNIPVTLYALSLNEEDVLRLDRESATVVLSKLGVSPRYVDYFWGFTSRSVMNVPLEECSAGALLRFYRRLIGRSGYRIGYPDVGLGDLFADASIRYIEKRNGRVSLNQKAVKILPDQSGNLAVELADGTRLCAGHVVAALPPRDALALLPQEWIDLAPELSALASFRAVPYISVYLWFDRKLTDKKFWARVFRDDDLNCDFYDFSNILGAPPRGSMIGSNIIDSERVSSMTDSELIERTIAELAQSVSSAKRARLEHAVVHRIPMAIPRPSTGAEMLRPNSRTRIPGFLLAGDWCRTGLPYSMESACASGWRAAEMVLEDGGTHTRLVRPHRELGAVAAMMGMVTRVARYCCR
jgi:uncharacterized protein with NAD-binding domain and iron-sulfur cluster